MWVKCSKCKEVSTHQEREWVPEHCHCGGELENYYKGQFDAKFRAFQLLTDFAIEFMGSSRQLTKAEGDAIHKHAAIIAKELTNGNYIYRERKPS